MINTTRALNRALDRLRPSDQFNVCAFDHRMVFYEPSLVPANKEKLSNCKTWITTYVPERGGTTIDAPIQYALERLEKSDLLPFLMLITDGAVKGEREICHKIEKMEKLQTRFLTLGIGTFCNWFFLKMLSKLGRGFNDTVLYREHIYHKMDHLLRMANTPVLTDFELDIKTDDVKLYPFPIPDLFIGAPCVVKIQDSKTCDLEEITISGYTPDGDTEKFVCPIKPSNDIPIHLINCLSEIDLMTADAWLNKSKEIETNVIDHSLAIVIPTMFTNLTAIKTTLQMYQVEGQKTNELLDESDDSKKMSKYDIERKLAKIKNSAAYASTMIFAGAVAAGIAARSLGSGGDGGNNYNDDIVTQIGDALHRCLDSCFETIFLSRDGGGKAADVSIEMDEIVDNIPDAFSGLADDIDSFEEISSVLYLGAKGIQASSYFIAAGVMSFGDVQATMDNIPFLGGGGDIDLDIDGCCCEDCEIFGIDLDCDCDCVVM